LPAPLSERDLRTLFPIAEQAPLFPAPASSSRPGLLLIAPWMILGGADRALADLVRGLRRERPELRLYLLLTLPNRMVWADQLLPLLDGVFSLPDLARDKPSETVAQLAERLSIDTVLIANSSAGLEALPSLRECARTPRCVVLLHAFGVDEKGALFGHAADAPARYDNLIDRYVAISSTLSEQLVSRFYVSPTKISVVRLGVDVDSFLPARRERLQPESPLKVLWLGRLSDEKNPLVVTSIAKAWRDRHGSGGIHFRVVGDGPLERELRAQVTKDKLEALVTVAGATNDPVADYRDADVLLLTSLSEGIPLVILEAMAAGLPIVTTTARTAIPEVLSEDDAYFIRSAQDPDEYVSVLERLAKERADGRQRAARLMAKRSVYDNDQFTAKMLDVLYPDVCRSTSVESAVQKAG
jgi:glycosyltransferase involved in cell wall biosynthesis